LLALRERGGGLAEVLWGFVDGRPRQNQWRDLSEVPPRTPESDAMSRDLKRLGFRFVGSTICYASMQSIGMGNDHVIFCFGHAEVLSGTSRKPWTSSTLPPSEI
jgi:DNA-3-methyladenine glycosylase I